MFYLVMNITDLAVTVTTCTVLDIPMGMDVLNPFALEQSLWYFTLSNAREFYLPWEKVQW